MVLNSVQNRFNFELDGWSPFGVFVCCSNHRLTPPTETRHLPLNLFLSQPRFLRPAACAPFFSVVVNFLTSPRQVTHKLCYRANFRSCAEYLTSTIGTRRGLFPFCKQYKRSTVTFPKKS